MISKSNLRLLLCHVLLTLPVAAQISKVDLKPNTNLRTFADPNYHFSFVYPGDWTFSRTDGEISTFHLDARYAPKKTQMRAVVAMGSNPFPASTFSGGYFYASVTPHSSASACSRQASIRTAGGKNSQPRAGQKTEISGIPFTSGHDEQKEICIVQRDEIYTTLYKSTCYRFDLVVNTYCTESSGIKYISPEELGEVESRLKGILSTVRFQDK